MPPKTNEWVVEHIKRNVLWIDNDMGLLESHLRDLLKQYEAEKDKEREEAVEARDKEWNDAIYYLIANSEGSQDWFNGLRACKGIKLPPPATH